MHTKGLNSRSLMTALLPVLFVTVPAVLAPKEGWSQQIEEVTVTARRREENVQDIPVAVASFNADFIEKQAMFSTKDVVKLVPGVQFDQGFSAADTRISIRGINNSRGRASVATLIDGIDISGENITAGGGGSLLNLRLFDLERIEVIKGPQSALYGRNAFAGAISYVTRKPSMDGLEMAVSGQAADYDTYNLKGTISGPLIADTLAMSLNLAAFTSDGYFNNNLTGQPTNGFGQPIDDGNSQKLNGYDSKGARWVTLWSPTDSLDITAAMTLAKDESDPRAVAKVGNANTFYDKDGNLLPGVTTPEFSAFSVQGYGQWLGTVGSVNESDVMLSRRGNGAAFEGSLDERQLYSINIDWDIGGVTFKSASSYLNNRAGLDEDADFQNGLGTDFMGVGLSLANDYTDRTKTKQYTQDFTLESADWEQGIWLVGAQYFKETVDNWDKSLGWYNDPATAFALPCGPNPFEISCSYTDSLAGGSPPKKISRDTDSYSFYGLIGYDFTEKFTATLEARYIVDDITVETNTAIDRVSQYLLKFPIDLAGIAPQPIPLPQSDSQKTKEFNPRVALDYKFTEELMVYGSAGKGTKPGGFGTSQMSLPQIARNEPETLYAYEVGAKTSWFDRTFTANAALFFNDYKDRQVGVTVTDPVSGWPSAGIVNAAGAETKGFEIELLWAPIEYLQLGLGYAYTDAEWTDYNFSDIRPNGVPTDKDQAICGNLAGDCSGAVIAGIPEDALTLIADFRMPISGGLELFVVANSQYQSERAIFDRVNTAYVDENWRVDAQIGLQTETWSVLLFAQNLLDDDTVLWGQGYQDFKDGMYGGSMGGEPRDESVMAFLPDPRLVGIRASWRYGN